jgi:hypothetical protein
MCLDTGTHPWKHTTIIILNKLNKLDYSVPKAYRPITLMECMGKVLERIVAKRVNNDIEEHGLLSMSQFGLRPAHCTVDAVATLVHRIQATRATNNTGALLLFDISGFFDNINPERAAHILGNLGFPENVRKWMLSFLQGCTTTLRIGDHSSQAFPINNGTPQGLPLSPILSALYTTSLLNITKTWVHKDLTLYVDNSAIYATSATTMAATEVALDGYKEVLGWLQANRLDADLNKTELMTFTQQCANPNIVGGPNTEARYNDPIRGCCTVRTVTHLRYLGVYIDCSLKWDRHVSIMTNQAHSTIRGINLLGNSIHGLDFLNWCKVYNALVIPMLTYSTQVWYTGISQKGLLHKMQVVQNEGIHKITRVFRTTPVEPLHNLMGIPPIPYLMTKLMDSYINRLWNMAP